MECRVCGAVADSGQVICEQCGVQFPRTVIKGSNHIDLPMKSELSRPAVKGMTNGEIRSQQKAYMVCTRCGSANYEQYGISINETNGTRWTTTSNASFLANPGGGAIIFRDYTQEVSTSVLSQFQVSAEKYSMRCKMCFQQTPHAERLLRSSEVVGRPKQFDAFDQGCFSVIALFGAVAGVTNYLF